MLQVARRAYLLSVLGAEELETACFADSVAYLAPPKRKGKRGAERNGDLLESGRFVPTGRVGREIMVSSTDNMDRPMEKYSAFLERSGRVPMEGCLLGPSTSARMKC